MSDTHIIDEYYQGTENSALDTESIHHTGERLQLARDFLNSLHPALDLVLLPGDVIHNYPSPDPSFYTTHTTRLDHARELLAGFAMPVHLTLGNHDYDVPAIPRELTHELFQEKLGAVPYHAVDHRGWKFILLNNFLGDTFDTASASYDSSTGSFGLAQLEWLEGELQKGLPTFVFLHFPLAVIKPYEKADYGLLTILRKHDNVRMAISGHVHRWMNLKTMFGPQHYVVSSTRYTEHAYMIFRIDVLGGGVEILNESCLHWGSYETDPFVT